MAHNNDGMKILTAQDAAREFGLSIQALKANPSQWCAVVVQWLAPDPAPWLNPDDLRILEMHAGRSLGLETAKGTLLVLPSGSLVMLLRNITSGGYRKISRFFEQTVADTGRESADVTCTAYDLSAMWKDFLADCRALYAQQAAVETKVKAKDNSQVKERLEKLLVDSAPLFARRDPRPRQLTLLFVEDEPSTRQLLNTLLSDQPLKLRFAANGAEAIESYCAMPPHVVFLDINLPDFSGLEVLEMLRRHDPNAFAIMLTSKSSTADVAFAKDNGVKGYIVKPFSHQKLKDCLQRYRDYGATLKPAWSASAGGEEGLASAVGDGVNSTTLPPFSRVR